MRVMETARQAGLRPVDIALFRGFASLSFPGRALLVGLWTANVVLVSITIAGFLLSDAGYDWLIFAEAGERVSTGRLYEWGGGDPFNYSPLLASFFALVAPIGYLGWSVLHFVALAALRDVRLAIIVGLSWPFWADVYNGNTMTFVLVAAVGALQASRIGTGAFLGLSLLMPRPLMVPLLLWILWKRPEWRIPFAAMVVVNIVLVFLTGSAGAWVETLLGVTTVVTASARDIGPAAVVGSWWLYIGLLGALILTLRGRVGLASLAASPYWLPQYLLMLLLELVPRSEPPRSD